MHSGPPTNDVALPAKRPIMLLMAALALILTAFFEATLARKDPAYLVLATLLGVPGGWLAVRFVAWSLRKLDKIDIFSPFAAFPAVYGLWFGVGSLTFWEDSNPPRYDYFLWGLVAYLAGALVIRRRRAAVREMGVSEGIPWSTPRFRLVVLALFLLMTSSYVLLIAQIGIPSIHADVALRRSALSSHHYLAAILQSAATTLMLFSAADLWSLKRALAPVVSGGIAVLAGLFLASFGNKGFLMLPVLTVLILRHYWKKAIPAGRVAIVLAVVFLMSVAYDYTRAAGIADEMGNETWDEVLYSSGAFLLHTNLSNFRDVVQAIPSEVPYQHGYLTFGVLLQILPGHHESSDWFFKRILASDFIGGGQPGTVLGPFYGDFGVAGILAGMFLFGALSAKTHNWMKERPTLLRVLLYSWLAQTAVLSVYGALVTYIITLWLPFMWWVLDRWMSAAAGSAIQRNRQATRSLIPA